MNRTVETLTIHSLDTTVLLVHMTSAQLQQWNWIAASDAVEGTLAHLVETDAQMPIDGYEVRDADGALLGAILVRRAGTIHAELYDAATGDFYSLGDTPQRILSQGAACILHAHRAAGRTLPAGEELVAPRYLSRRRSCPWGWCFDAYCPDHGPIWDVPADGPLPLSEEVMPHPVAVAA